VVVNAEVVWALGKDSALRTLERLMFTRRPAKSLLTIRGGG
jgi:hypothetical protein